MPPAATLSEICGNLRPSADQIRPPSDPGGFNAGFAAFWWSHVAKNRVDEFLTKFHRQLLPGSAVMLLDNRFVPGSSIALSRTDAEGNTYQSRRLDSGETHEVLKNFPEPEELERALAPFGATIRVELLEHYWVATYQARRRQDPNVKLNPEPSGQRREEALTCPSGLESSEERFEAAGEEGASFRPRLRLNDKGGPV